MTSFTNGSLCKDYARNYVSFVRVDSPISKILFTKKDRRIYFYDQLGTFGGTFGLFMGVSVISIFEVCFFIFHILMAIMKFFTTDIRNITYFDTDESYQKKLLSALKIKELELKVKVS